MMDLLVTNDCLYVSITKTFILDMLSLRVKTIGNGWENPLTIFTRISFYSVGNGKWESWKRNTVGKIWYIKNG
jgi:hypothetical protein